jgi:hypothetical protein
VRQIYDVLQPGACENLDVCPGRPFQLTHLAAFSRLLVCLVDMIYHQRYRNFFPFPLVRSSSAFPARSQLLLAAARPTMSDKRKAFLAQRLSRIYLHISIPPACASHCNSPIECTNTLFSHHLCRFTLPHRLFLVVFTALHYLPLLLLHRKANDGRVLHTVGDMAEVDFRKPTLSNMSPFTNFDPLAGSRLRNCEFAYTHLVLEIDADKTRFLSSLPHQLCAWSRTELSRGTLVELQKSRLSVVKCHKYCGIARRYRLAFEPSNKALPWRGSGTRKRPLHYRHLRQANLPVHF